MLYKQESLISFDHYKKSGGFPFLSTSLRGRKTREAEEAFQSRARKKKVVMQCPPLPKEKTQEQLHTIKQEIR